MTLNRPPFSNVGLHRRAAFIREIDKMSDATASEASR